MSQLKISASAIIDAHADNIYSIIADYRHGHPQIIPPEYMYDLQVEKGGYGAGTTIRFKMKVLGVEQSLYQRVSEPEPGRVLVEQDVDSSQSEITTFTVDPIEQGQKSHVQISTVLNLPSGITGAIQKWLLSMIIPQIYKEELKLLEGVARKQEPAVA